MESRSTSLATGCTIQTECDTPISASGPRNHVIELGGSSQRSQHHNSVEDGGSLSSEQGGAVEVQHLGISASDTDGSLSLEQPQQDLHPKKGLSAPMSTLIVINTVSVSYILIPGGTDWARFCMMTSLQNRRLSRPGSESFHRLRGRRHSPRIRHSHYCLVSELPDCSLRLGGMCTCSEFGIREGRRQLSIDPPVSSSPASQV